MLANHYYTSLKMRGHTGLQQLSTLVTSVKSFLGPVKSCKFIFDHVTNESTLTCSSFRLLESLDLTTGVGQLLNETVQAHHQLYKTGTTTLFLLVGAWSNAVLECLHQGVPVSLIVAIMLEALNSCIEHVESLQVPLHNLILDRDWATRTQSSRDQKHCANPCSNKDFLSTCDYTAEDNSTFKCSSPFIKHVDQSTLHKPVTRFQPTLRNKLSHSRHFSVAERSCIQDNSEGFRAGPSHSHVLEVTAKALCHGNQEVMGLVQTAFNLLENARKLSATKNLIHASQFHTCCLPGLSEDYCNASIGFTTLVSQENAAIIHNLEGKALQVLLLDGDLTETYRHLGFNFSTNLKTVSEVSRGEGDKAEESWNSRAFKEIIQGNIDLILVRGDICPILLKQCMHRNVLIVTQVRQNVLQAFGESTGAEAITYITQFNQHCIGRGVYVSMCTGGSSIDVGGSIAITIKENKMNFLTIVLSSRIASKMQVMEDRFWACTYRLLHAMKDGMVFHGGGAVEFLCLSHLRTLEKDSYGEEITDSAGRTHTTQWMAQVGMQYKTFIFRCFAKGWCKYLSVLLCNIGEYTSELDAMTFIENELQNISHRYSPSAYILNEYTKKVFSVDDLGLAVADKSVPVYDNVGPKMEAWRRALHLVLLILQTDAEIITDSATQGQILKDEFSKEEYFFL